MTSTKRRGRPPQPDRLTRSEWSIVHATQHGLSRPDIARRTGVSVNAVKYHLSNIFSKLNIENRAALRQWFGMPAHRFPQPQEIPVNNSLKLTKIGQISRSVSDINMAEAWYGSVLGLEHLFTAGKLAFFDCDGTRLMLSAEGALAQPESILYLSVPDIAMAYTELQARGASFVAAPHMIHRHADGAEEWMAFFNDPDGRPLAIMSLARP